MKQNLVLLRKQIIETGSMAYKRGYVASNDGNISARVDKNKIIVTPAGVSKGLMKPNDLVIAGLDGKAGKSRNHPTSELFMHLSIYRARPDVNGICHLHPPHATGFAVAGIPFDTDFLTEAALSLGRVELVEYGTPGTEELSSKLLPHLKNADVFILANHGALTLGNDIYDAYNKMEILEHSAHILLVARQLGYVNRLTGEDLKKLEMLGKKNSGK
jgi:L-fuculose-phosphate aldolase